MKKFSCEDAMHRIRSFYQPVDEGVRDSLINFMVIADRLNVATTESCHGHVDWIFSYPTISFDVKHVHQRRVPIWNVYQRYKRYTNKREINANLKKRVEDSIFFLTREIIQFHQDDKTDPHLFFSVIRTNGFSFRIVAAFPNYSRGLRKAGMWSELEELMTKQRAVLIRLSEFILGRVEGITSLDGTNRCSCDVCRIKH